VAKMGEVKEVSENTRLIDTFTHRGYCYNVDEKEGYRNFIDKNPGSKCKLVYVFLYDPGDQKIAKEGFIVRTMWKRYKKRNIVLKYKDEIYNLSDFKPFTEYMTSLHGAYDYKKAL
jgi:hypothetical protein